MLKNCNHCNAKLPEQQEEITIQDVYNAFHEHAVALDKLWPDTDQFGPRKVHIVELLDAIKLRLVQMAERNSNKHESAFDRAAKRVTGAGKRQVEKEVETPAETKSAMQLAHEQARERMKRG